MTIGAVNPAPGRVGVVREMPEEERNHINILYRMKKTLVLATIRLYFRHSDEALKTIGMRGENCTKRDVWSTQLPSKIRNFNNVRKLKECQTHLQMALDWRKREYDEKKKQQRDESESHMKELQSMITVIEDIALPAINQRLSILT